MSSQGGPKPPNEGKQEGFVKYLQRMRTVLRKGSSSKSESASIPQESSGQASPSQPAPPKTTAAAAPKTTTAPAKGAPANSGPAATVFKHWGAIQEEKARSLFAKYGLTLEPGEWKPTIDTEVQRVAKPIRMRVRRTCHRCQTTFGIDKLCTNCQHVRCKKCPRYPPQKSHDHTESALQTILSQKGKEPIAAAAATAAPRKAKSPPITIPSRTGGQDLVRKEVKQRVRRTCHRCCTTFAPESTECENCKHTRCKKCPREPPKLDKYPDGYPGDVEPPAEPPARTWKKPRLRVRYTCHQCSTLYRSGENTCSNCGQEKCSETIRNPPKKQKPEPDPEVLRRVEERLNVTISAG